MELLQLACSTYQHTLPLGSLQLSAVFPEFSGFWSLTLGDQTSNMAVQKFFILSVLITQALSAPSGCTESCIYLKHQSQTPGIQDHIGLSQTATHLQGLDYSRPGTWSEHNDYNVDNGHGKVHEEKGQLVEGPKTVRYYKKNYTSSYSTGFSNGAGSDSEHQSNSYRQGVYVPNTDDTLNSQRAYSQVGNTKSTAHQNYHRTQNQQLGLSSLRGTNAHSERLEDFGEYNGNSHMIQQGVSGANTQVSQEPYNANAQSGNWSRADSYKTDGGNGRVFEEEGQYTTGASKVRFYKRNYTSSYTSSDGVPMPDVAKVGVHDIHKEIEKLHKEIGKGFSQISTVENMGSNNMAQTYINGHDLFSDNVHNANNNYKSRESYGSSSSTRHRNEGHVTDSAYERLPYINPSQNTYGTNSYSAYERHEGRVVKLQPSSQLISPTSGYTNVLSTGNSGYQSNLFNEATSQQQTHNLQQAELSDTHQSKLIQSQTLLDNLRNNEHTQGRTMHYVSPERATRYQEHWSASSTKEASVPQYSDISQTNQQMSQYNSNQYEHRHNEQQSMQHQDNYSHRLREGGMSSGRNTHLGRLIIGALDPNQGRDTVDCAYSTEHTHGSTQYQRKYKRNANYNEHDEAQQVGSKVFYDDFTQQADQFDDLTQQASGKLEFGQESQQSYQPWEPNTGIHKLEDLTQQTGELDDFTQQTSGKLEFGQGSQQSYQPWEPNTGIHKLEDLTQQTGELDDLTQQTSGKLEFGQGSQQSYQPWEPSSGIHKLEDLTQQTGELDDLTQQTSGKLEFGQGSQQAYQPWEPKRGNQKVEDLTQQTGEFDDLTQQASGKLEFGEGSQQSYRPWEPSTGIHKFEDLTQQTGEFHDLTQQTSGKLEFGQESQQSYQPWEPKSGTQKVGDLTQQTGEFDDLTQQTSGKLEFGQESQQSYQPWEPKSGNQKVGDLTQQTGEFDDLTQQTSGKLEFGQESQQSYQPWEPKSGNQKVGDLTQQTGEFDDLTQQTSGKLEFGQGSQQSYQPWEPKSGNQKVEDLTQQTGEFDDLTQQASGKLEFGEGSQQSYQPWEPKSGTQKVEDLTQQTGEFDDLTQQTSGKLEFGQGSQQLYRPWEPKSGNQKVEDLTQQTGEFDDLTQQTSGKLEFGEGSQQSYQPWEPKSSNQKVEDLTQQTGDFDDFTQQTSGKLEFGPGSQQSYQPWEPKSGNQKVEDLTQQTGEFDDLTQQTSGKLEFGEGSQQSYQPWEPKSSNQKVEDLTQQTGDFDDLTQQTSGKLEFGPQSQQTYEPWKLSSGNQKLEDLAYQSQHMPSQGELDSHVLKPAEKPKPRSRYSRVGSSVSIQLPKITNFNEAAVDIPTINEVPPQVGTNDNTGVIRNANVRGDQSSNNKDTGHLNQQPGSSGFDIEGENVDQVNRLHKSNDATVGVQWHYTYHPSDQRQLVQQTDQKDKEGIQQQSSETRFSNLEHNLNQHVQNQYIHGDSPRQSGASQEGVKTIRRKMLYSQQQNKLMLDQQTSEDLKKNTRSSETSHQLEPRILEAFGGGEYDPHHSEDAYLGVTANPSATLLPIIRDVDAWYIREKPRETVTTTEESTLPPMPVEPLNIDDAPGPENSDTNETTTPANVWSKIGHKITSTFDKAKEKARAIFG